MQRIRHKHEEHWPHQILTNSCVVGVDTDSSERVRLQIARMLVGEHGERDIQTKTEDFNADLVIIATGYTRNYHEKLLTPARYLLPGGDEPGKKWMVSRDYEVQFEHGMVSEDAGVYLQGCNEDSHGVS
jgi:L-ornithine N5-oxygenase